MLLYIFCRTGRKKYSSTFVYFEISWKIFTAAEKKRGEEVARVPHWHAENEKYQVFSTTEPNFCSGRENSPPMASRPFC